MRLFIVTLVLMAGCRSDEPPAAAPAAEPADPIAQKLDAIRDVLARAHAEAQATALRRAADEAALEALDREAAAAHLSERIPDEPGPPALALRADLDALARESGVTLGECQILARPLSRRALPEVVREPFDWTDDDLRSITDVRLRVETGGKEALRRFLDALRDKLPRLLVPTKVASVGGGFDVYGEVYAFATPAPPRHAPLRPALDDLLQGAGLTRDEIRSKAARASLAACEHEQVWIKKVSPGAEKALIPASELRLRQAAHRFFKDRLRARKDAFESGLLVP